MVRHGIAERFPVDFLALIITKEIGIKAHGMAQLNHHLIALLRTMWFIHFDFRDIFQDLQFALHEIGEDNCIKCDPSLLHTWIKIVKFVRCLGIPSAVWNSYSTAR